MVCKQLWLNSLRAAGSEDRRPPRRVTVAEEMQINSVRGESGWWGGEEKALLACCKHTSGLGGGVAEKSGALVL